MFNHFYCVNFVNPMLMSLAYQLVICSYVGICPVDNKFIAVVIITYKYVEIVIIVIIQIIIVIIITIMNMHLCRDECQ